MVRRKSGRYVSVSETRATGAMPTLRFKRYSGLRILPATSSQNHGKDNIAFQRKLTREYRTPNYLQRWYHSYLRGWTEL